MPGSYFAFHSGWPKLAIFFGQGSCHSRATPPRPGSNTPRPKSPHLPYPRSSSAETRAAPAPFPTTPCSSRRLSFGKAARIHDAELRVDRGPAVGRRLAAIVETGPGKAAGQPLARSIERDPILGAVWPTGTFASYALTTLRSLSVEYSPRVDTVLAVSDPYPAVWDASCGTRRGTSGCS